VSSPAKTVTGTSLLLCTKSSVTPQKCTFCLPIAVCVRVTSLELCLPRVGWKESFCPVFSCALGYVLSATNDGICRPSNNGRPSPTPGDETNGLVSSL
jgi:hypothetical protein